MTPTLKEINIYPIKGLAGFKVTQATCLERGLKNDRRYMLIDEKGKFISQREFPSLCLFKTKINDDNIQISFENENITVGNKDVLPQKVESKIWSHQFRSLTVSPHINNWFSDRIGIKCQLVHMDKSIVRNKTLIKSPNITELSYADGYPYLILGTKSLDHLNQKLSESISMSRFRPSLVIETQSPHEEDAWDKIIIGQSNFRIIKPCARCQVITIDPASATVGKEPLATLSRYRKFGNKINFGANAITLSKSSTIKVGDPIKVL